MENKAAEIQARSLKGLMDETFAVYGKHFWLFIGLVALAQAPISILAIVLFEAFDGNGSTIGFALVFGITGTIFTVLAYTSGVLAVAYQYVSCNVKVRICYTRAWWKIVSLLLFSVMVSFILAIPVIALVVILAFVLASLGIASMVALATLGLIMAFALTALWSMSVNAVIVEGYRPIRLFKTNRHLIGIAADVPALSRILTLTRGSWIRIIGVIALMGLVAFGLSILITTPFALLLQISGIDQTSTLSTAIAHLNGLLVQVVVPPVLFIAGTLLYYDLRVRKEKYSLTTLSRELGVVAV